MSTAPQPNRPDSAARRTFILRHGILRYGLVLGLAIFAWAAAGDYSTTLERLRTPAGWLIGSLIWLIRHRPLPPPRPSHRRQV